MPAVRIQDTAKAIVLVIASLLASLLLLELAIRFYSALAFPKMMVLDERLGWKHAKSREKVFVNEYGQKARVVQNAHGNRGPQIEYSRQENKYRILILGDSFTEGAQVDEADLFSAHLQRNMTNVEIINAGVGGYSTVQEYLYLVSEGIKYNPDLVLLMVFENDFRENCLPYYPVFGPRPFARTVGTEVEIVDTPDGAEFVKFLMPFPFRFQLSRHSYLFYFLNTEVYQKLFASSMRKLLQQDQEKLSNSCDKYRIFEYLIVKIDLLLKAREAEFGLVLIPSREAVTKGNSQIYAPVTELCRKRNLHCLNLLEQFAVLTQSGAQLYFPVDIHWTKDGHRIAAEEIANFIRSLNKRMSRRIRRTEA